MATPAAPTPAMTTRSELIGLSTMRSAFSSAARATTAVPCWSSWKTGMSSRSLSRSSISKQAGAAMSSRLMPPNTGAMRTTVSTISSGGGDVEADREGVDAGEVLEQERLALHHRQGAGRADVAEPEHRGAVGDDGDGVLLDGELVGQRRAAARSRCRPGPRPACRPSRGRRGRRSACGRAPRSCRPRASRRCGRRPRAPRRRRRRAPPRSPARCAPRSVQLTSTSSSRWAPRTSKPPMAVMLPPDVADGGGQAAEGAGAVVEADAQADGVRGGGGGHGGGPVLAGGSTVPRPSPDETRHGARPVGRRAISRACRVRRCVSARRRARARATSPRGSGGSPTP